MNFPHSQNLELFLRQNNVFTDFEGIREIHAGGNSYNFCVQTKHKKYFLKLFSDEQRFAKIYALCKLHNILYPSEFEDFAQYKLLIMPYLEGHKLYYEDCRQDFIEKLCRQYENVRNCQLDRQYIAAKRDMTQLCTELENLFQTRKGKIVRFLYKNIWKIIAPSLITLPETENVIHGDFTANNIMVTSDNAPVVLDWEELRYGYAAEDWCGLCLELAGFRGLYGSCRHLRRLCGIIQSQIRISETEWLYGTQMFYVRMLIRRLNNSKKQSWRKQLCLLICIFSYFRAQKVIKGTL